MFDGRLRRARCGRLRAGPHRRAVQCPPSVAVSGRGPGGGQRGRCGRRRAPGQQSAAGRSRRVPAAMPGPAWSVRDDALLIDLAGLAGHDRRRRQPDRDRPARRLRGGQDLGPFLRAAWSGLSRRALLDGRPRRIPAAGRPGLELAAVGMGAARTCSASMSSQPTASWCTPTPIRTATCTGPPAEPARRSSAWSRASTCACTGCPMRSRTPRTRSPSSASTS